MKTSIFSRALCAAAFALVALAPAQATPITYQLNDATFSDGATAKGTFTYDAESNTVSAFDLQTSAGLLSAFDYNKVTSTVLNFSGMMSNYFLFIENAGTRYFSMSFVDTVGTAGANLLNTNISQECMNCGLTRTIVAGNITAAASDVPEPSTPLLLLAAIAGMALVRRHRESSAQ